MVSPARVVARAQAERARRDDAALAAVGDAPKYAATPLSMAPYGVAARGKYLQEGLAMADGSNVNRRIERILDDSRRCSRPFGRRTWTAVLACAVPLMYVTSAARLAPAPNET